VAYRKTFFCRAPLDGDHLGAPPGEQNNVINATDNIVPLYSTAGTAYPSMPTPPRPAVLALYNDAGSEVIVRAEEFRLVPVMDTGPSSSQLGYSPEMEVYRLAAMGDGEDVPAAKLDSASTDLPPQVLVEALPKSFTLGTRVIRGMEAPLWGRAMGFPISLSGENMGDRNLRGSNILYAGYGDALSQRMTLREGEGLGLVVGQWTSSRAAAVHLHLRVVGTGQSHIYSKVLVPFGSTGSPFFGVFNGAGSGVVLEVVLLELQECRDLIEVPLYSVEYIDALAGGEDVAPVPADSTHALPGYGRLLVRKNCLITPAGMKRGAMLSVAQKRRAIGGNCGWGPNQNLSAMPVCSPSHALAHIEGTNRGTDDIEPMRIREGEGVALVLKNGSGIGKFDALLTFTVESRLEMSRPEMLYVS